MAIVLSVAAMIPAFIGVDLDLGHMERLYRVLTAPTFTSMIAFNAWMYNIFLIVAVVTWLLSFKNGSVWLKPLLVFGAFLSILFPSQSGVFFEAVRINEFWHSPILSVLFLASAIALGAAGLLLARSVYGLGLATASDREDEDHAARRLRIIAVLGILVYVVFEFAEFSIALWTTGPHSPNVEFLLFGDYWAVFWIRSPAAGRTDPSGAFRLLLQGALGTCSPSCDSGVRCGSNVHPGSRSDQRSDSRAPASLSGRPSYLQLPSDINGIPGRVSSWWPLAWQSFTWECD